VSEQAGQAPTSTGTPEAPAAVTAPSPWRLAWQIPALVAGVAGLVVGGMYAFKTSPIPDFKGAMDVAEHMVDEREYQHAIDYANKNVYPFITKGLVTDEDITRFHLMVGRAIARGQREKSLNVAENHQNIISSYGEAVKRGAQLTPEDTADIADSYLALGKVDEAIAEASTLPEASRHRRDQINRKVIEQTLEGPRSQRARAIEMLTDMLAEAELPAEERMWALARQAELLVDQGFPEEAIDKLLRAIPRLTVAGHEETMGELYVWLARAYMDTRDLASAAVQLERASEILPPENALQAKVGLMAARILESRNELSEAKERYDEVLANFSDTHEEMDALLGLAGLYAQRDEHGEAADTYGILVSRLLKGDKHPTITPASVTDNLMSRFRERFEAEDIVTAQRYATMAEDLFGAEQAPDVVIQAQAEVNKRLADAALGGAKSAMAKLELDPAAATLAQRHFRLAAKYFRMVADRTVVTDPNAYLTALWSAADCFDRAGDRERAIAAFDEFAKSFPEDPRQPEAIFRLAEAYKASGELSTAAELYRTLIEAQERGDAASAGPFADASYVPLAQTYLLDNDPANDKEAEQKLLAVASGRLGGTNTDSFRESVIELGNLYFQTAQYEMGITRLREALARYGDDPRAPSMSFRLGECSRLSAVVIEKELGDAMPDAQRRELTEARAERLRDAASAYEGVAAAIGNKDARRRSALDELMLRNATFYVADCAYDLGQYETAIRLYDAAREKYPKDPASLVAMTQIVSAHLKQGDYKRAATANERARRFYASLPESAWDDPNLPMSRRDWERWLESTSKLNLQESQDGASGRGGQTAGAGESSG
jgi:tetratricopeptide (TPR) repeat protein